MKLIWLSVAPWSPTGYGTVTRQVVPRIQAEGHEVTVACKHFHTGTVVWEGIPTIQGVDLNILNRMVDKGEADYIISLLDNHAIEGAPKNWISYTPFDTHKIPFSISRTLDKPLMIIALTKHGQSEIERAGYECLYAPHGVDTSIYCPDEVNRQKGREKLEWEDKFIIGTVGVNYADDRKNLTNLLLAFKWFHARHDEARLYLSVNPLHTDNNNDVLPREVDDLGLNDLIQWANPDQYFMGKVGDKMMANRYRMMDVFCMPTKGEGFGLPLIEAQACGTPVITTGASTGPELCPTQYLIPVPDHEWEWFNKEWRPLVSAKSILDTLEKAYNDKNLREVGMEGHEFAQDYDWDTLHEKYWKPILKEIEGLKTKVQTIPDYRRLHETFNGRITMSDCEKWCDKPCKDSFPLLPGEKQNKRSILSRSYPVIPDRDGNLLVNKDCPLHNWISKRFKKEVKEVWSYLWGFPIIRDYFKDSIFGNDLTRIEYLKFDFNDEYKWAMQSQYHTNFPDITEYLHGEILEVGCGDGSRVKELRDKGLSAMGLEFNPYQVDGNSVVHGDAHAIPFYDDHYDVVYSVDVLEHLDNPVKALAEMFRVSKDLVINSITPVESSCFWEDPTHKVEWDKERWKREINEFGEIIDILEPFTIVARRR